MSPEGYFSVVTKIKGVHALQIQRIYQTTAVCSCRRSTNFQETEIQYGYLFIAWISVFINAGIYQIFVIEMRYINAWAYSMSILLWEADFWQLF